MSTPIYFHKVKELVNLKPNSLVALKKEVDTDFILYVTDKEGVPYPMKDIGRNSVKSVVNTDGSLVITGDAIKIINLNPTLLTLINTALQSGDNISELVNDAGYLTSFTEEDPIFTASEAFKFEDGDKTNLDNQSGTNTNDETKASIQAKRPLKTVDNKSIEGAGNIEINYNTIINKPTAFPPSSHTHPISEVVGLGSALNEKLTNNLTNARIPFLGVGGTNVLNDSIMFQGDLAIYVEGALQADRNIGAQSFVKRNSVATNILLAGGDDVPIESILPPASVDQSIIDGSTNAVSGNAVNDALLLKSDKFLLNPSLSYYDDNGTKYLTSNISSFTQSFLWSTGNSTLFTLTYPITNLISIFVNGLKLYSATQFQLILPNKIQILQTLLNGDVVEIIYEHYNTI